MRPADGLARLQEAFEAAVTGAGDEAIGRHLAGDCRHGLAVYRHAVAAARERALRGAFGVVSRLVGEAFLAEAARRYGERSPPACADLNRYGEGFPGFLAAYEHAASMPWLADVARLEWAVHESMGAADLPPLDFGELARVPEERQEELAFTLHPSVRLVRSPWPVLAIWQANQDGCDGTPDRDEGADDVLVWRDAGAGCLERLGPREADVVEGLLRGLALGEAAALGEGDHLGGLLGMLAGRGLLVAFCARPPRDP